MRLLRLLVCLIPAALANAQSPDDALQQGAVVFAKTCGSGYCHGPKGAGGGAPRLSGRGFEPSFIANTVARGIAGTAMQGFSTALSRGELAAVVAYVAALNGIAAPPSAATPREAPEPPALSPEAAQGHELFFDAVRGFARCATCHEVNGVGIPVATPIAKVPAGAAALRALATPAVLTARMNGESMPALLVSKTARGVIFYDLTTPPPVLRTVPAAAVETSDGSAWKHASVTGSYSDAELSSILAYLRAVVKP